MKGDANDDVKRTAALAYTNEDVIFRFLKLYDIEREEAEAVFAETLKWLWLCAHHKGAGIYPEMIMLDEMWHNFVLFTTDYASYCEEHYGRYLHHQPQTAAEAAEWERREADDFEGAKADYLERYEAQLEKTADLFGEETVIRWHVEYRNRYGEEFFATKTKAPNALHAVKF